jgi:hypothetical protein
MGNYVLYETFFLLMPIQLLGFSGVCTSRDCRHADAHGARVGSLRTTNGATSTPTRRPAPSCNETQLYILESRASSNHVEHVEYP